MPICLTRQHAPGLSSAKRSAPLLINWRYVGMGGFSLRPIIVIGEISYFTESLARVFSDELLCSAHLFNGIDNWRCSPYTQTTAFIVVDTTARSDLSNCNEIVSQLKRLGDDSPTIVISDVDCPVNVAKSFACGRVVIFPPARHWMKLWPRSNSSFLAAFSPRQVLFRLTRAEERTLHRHRPLLVGSAKAPRLRLRTMSSKWVASGKTITLAPISEAPSA